MYELYEQDQSPSDVGRWDCRGSVLFIHEGVEGIPWVGMLVTWALTMFAKEASHITLQNSNTCQRSLLG